MSHDPTREATLGGPDGLFVALRPLGAASSLEPAWRDLCRRCLVENLFLEADFALAAAGAFGADVQVLLVCDRPPEDPRARLLALWPCRIQRRWGVPLRVLAGWTHGFAVFGVPLLDAAEAERALEALLDAPARLGLPPRLLMPYLPLDGPFATLLERVLAVRGARHATFWEHARAGLDLADLGPEARAAYLRKRLSPRKARQFARLGRRLAGVAPVVHETVRASSALPGALDDYVALEAAGWKGRAGTALGGRPAEVAFLHRVVRAYGAAGRVRIDRLRREGRSLASSFAVETETTLWYLKISYDEAEAANSPGAQLVLHVTRTLLADLRLRAADSCAPPGYPVIETFWGGRRRLAHLLIEAGGGDPLFSLAVRLERLRAFMSRARTRIAAVR